MTVDNSQIILRDKLEPLEGCQLSRLLMISNIETLKVNKNKNINMMMTTSVSITCLCIILFPGTIKNDLSGPFYLSEWIIVQLQT